MKHFNNGQRVKVVRVIDDDGNDGVDTERAALIGMTGKVVRLRFKDMLAWVEMDQEMPWGLTVFPRGDARANHILLSPAECEPA